MSDVWSYWHGSRRPIIDLCVETIERHNPGFRLLSQQDVESLGGQDLLALTRDRAPFLQSDLIRLWLLKEFGGQWVDADCIGLSRLDMADRLTEDCELVGYTNGAPRHFANNILAARKNGQVITKAFDACYQLIKDTPSTQPIPYGATGQAILGELYRLHSNRVRRLQRWRYSLIRFTRSQDYMRRATDGRHAVRPAWNAAACTYHLTNKLVAGVKDQTREQLLKGKTFLSFLLRRALGRVRPMRAREILSRLRGHQSPVGVEVGVLKGENAEILLQQRKDLTLYLVDPWQSQSTDSSYKKSRDANAFRGDGFWRRAHELARRRTVFAGDRARLVKDLSANASKVVPDGLDFVFIDADHSYAGCSGDIASWLPKIKPGGWIGGHDYNHRLERQGFWGVSRAVQEASSRLERDIEVGADGTWFIRV